MRRLTCRARPGASATPRVMTSPSLFEVRGLRVAVGSRVLIEALDVTLPAGARRAVQGPSGSGKTTLLRTFAGLVDAAAGTVRLEGRPPEALGYPLWRRRVGWFPQRPVLFGGTVEDEVRRPFRFATAEQAFDGSRAEQWLAALGLGGRFSARTRDFSEGERQRVALVRGLLVDPRVLLLDEPTSALDPAATDAAEALIVERTDAGAAALLVTHSAAQAARLCDGVITLDNGRARSDEPTKEVHGA